MDKYCIKCQKPFSKPGRYCDVCKHKKLGKKCPDCGIDISDVAKYCGIHNQFHRPPGNGFKIHATKIRNNTYSPIGSERIGSKGYVMIKISNGNSHINGEGNYKAKHRFIIEKIIGRELTNKETVHHIDGNKINNDPENLLLMVNKDHNKINHFLGLLAKSQPEDQEKIIKTIYFRFPHLFTIQFQNLDQ